MNTEIASVSHFPSVQTLPFHSRVCIDGGATGSTILNQTGGVHLDDLFVDSLLEKRVVLPITSVNADLEENLLKSIVDKVHNKCVEEGYILSSSIRLEQYSVGKLTTSGIEFIVLVKCKVCHPVEGMVVRATISDITKAGVHAACYTEDNQKPLTVYVLRDHEYKHPLFEEETRLKKNMPITVRIVGVRYELNDSSIHAIAEFAE